MPVGRVWLFQVVPPFAVVVTAASDGLLKPTAVQAAADVHDTP